ncbi:hypothetical protein [Massilia sp. TS11]|uniref:hypothetical protein n=1 Tax=Massilia sp. TS11 TaxID=2908003 RepID=UPI001EDA809C|nr:hypothetical protein [Massilia sp. TS11]MCG2582971.1 hypothetical protein [Massilia sp. TS11]
MLRRAAFALLLSACTAVLAAPRAYQFAAIGHLQGSETRLRHSLAQAGEAPNAFIVATGIKGQSEPCADSIYQQRRAMFDEALRPTIVVPAASDWSDCRNSAGRSNAVERLNRLRELFYPDMQSLGSQKLKLGRLSLNSKFRSYAEYAEWEMGGVLYATLNLPSDNNHFRREAGRNSEFEDRLVANRNWLLRLFRVAKSKKLEAIVLFAEADLSDANKQEGFAEVKKQLRSLVKTYPGKLLLVDAAPPADSAIVWQDKIGHLSLGATAVTVKVTPGTPQLFSLEP